MLLFNNTPIGKNRLAVLRYLLSRPDDWASCCEIKDALKYQRDACRSALDWLIEFKHVTKTKDGGRVYFAITKTGLDTATKFHVHASTEAELK